ncbi:MAG: 4Fe-4S dicluster domain-containing protein [Syntrophobacterales bacterium]|jgi:anaerobic dimethyl sulfoxide reductase subunit B (iron-sulfur subunit)|nr:4Fe-4S dicluster domain-containing protein [Syntrophobacterales bacterium]
MAQYAIFFDQSRCYSCHACSVACKDWNGIEPGPEKWMTVYEWEKGTFPDLRVHHLAFSCGHCENPVCLKSCPNNAIIKEEKYGAVLIDKQKCKGTRRCAVACPYGAPKFASEAPGTKMSKCTLCIDRLERGEKPICVLSCPLRAFDFGPLEEMIAKYGNQRQLEEMPDPSATKPAFIVKPQDPKRQLIPYNKDAALELMKNRGDLGTVFEDVTDVTNVSPETVRRSRLKMKHASLNDLMTETQNDIG